MSDPGISLGTGASSNGWRLPWEQAAPAATEVAQLGEAAAQTALRSEVALASRAIVTSGMPRGAGALAVLGLIAPLVDPYIARFMDRAVADIKEFFGTPYRPPAEHLQQAQALTPQEKIEDAKKYRDSLVEKYKDQGGVEHPSVLDYNKYIKDLEGEIPKQPANQHEELPERQPAERPEQNDRPRLPREYSPDKPYDGGEFYMAP